ncbi:MAG TPA: hypothetical protein VLT33_15850, partial [Labilithrix sp.]|nr:hypothetical protein [Labilithrix sp.]
MRRALPALVLAMAFQACGPAPAPLVAKPPVAAPPAAGATGAAPDPGGGAAAWTYDVTAQPRGTSLAVTARFPRGTPAS